MVPLIDDWSKGDWILSVVDDDLLMKYSHMGLIPSRDLNNWRVPVNESVPPIMDDKCMLHLPIVELGLSLPLHDFMRGLLFAYGMQLHHLNPKSVMHTSCFITLCKCFLGTRPHWGLWKQIFYLKAWTIKAGEWLSICGGASFQVKTSIEYFNL